MELAFSLVAYLSTQPSHSAQRCPMSTALVIEDSSTYMELLSECLRQDGYTVLQATSEEEAMQVLKSQKPDLIFLDVVLPGRSGFEICRDLKDADDTRSIPVVMCSTKNTEMDRFWGKKQGADAYVGKPFNPDEILATAREVLQ